jgi:hypothetical protein
LNEPIAIRDLKRFVSEHHSDLWKQDLKPPTPTGKKIAIIGSGPAGLSAGYYLARKGHEATIFEQTSSPGGMLKHAISRKRLPKKALDKDIQEILQTGVKLELNSPKTDVDELLKEGFDAVLLATGSNFVGPTIFWLNGRGKELTPKGSLNVDLATMTYGRDCVFAGGDAVLKEISEDFIQSLSGGKGKGFFNVLVEQLVSHRGDSSRSAIRAIVSGRKAAEVIDKYLGGNGTIEETLLPPEKPTQYLGRVEGFADQKRLSESHHAPPPQFAGLSKAEEPLTQEEAIKEANRCLRCDLRLLFSKHVLPPRKRLWVEYNQENVAAVPEKEGVFQLLDEQEIVIYIKGAMNLKQELTDQLELNQDARFFMIIEDQMFSKRESEMLQHYIIEFGKMPKINQEMEDLF